MPLNALSLTALTSLVMVAFAANSILSRLALVEGLIDSVSFASLRVISGAAMLLILLAFRGALVRQWQWPRMAGVAGLSLYMIGFTLAYVSLDAGVGALVLFAVVQFAMFAWVVAQGQRIPALQWLGMGVALGGLALMLWPTQAVVLPGLALVLMILAGLGWAAFSLAGSLAPAPLPAATWTFALLVPPFLLLFGINFANAHMTWAGIGLALTSGALTSGLGYALWYWVLPTLGAVRAAVAQLTVPALAILMGLIFLNEALTLRFWIAAGIILAGTLLALLTKPKM